MPSMLPAKVELLKSHTTLYWEKRSDVDIMSLAWIFPARKLKQARFLDLMKIS